MHNTQNSKLALDPGCPSSSLSANATPPRRGFLPKVFSSANEALSGIAASYGQLVRFDEDDEENEYDEPYCPSPSHEEQEVLLYLIRHGEAEHNIEEKKAMEEARRIAMADEGLSEDDPRVQERMEEARKAVLNDAMLRDAKLSPQGKCEAERARDKLQALIKDDNGLEKPDYVLVSPLTRTLETCDIIFPDSDNIHVREEISERRTGKPADTRSSVHWLSLRPSFQRFSMVQLRATGVDNSAEKRRKGCLNRCCSTGDEEGQYSCQRKGESTFQQSNMVHSRSSTEIFLMSDDLFNGADQHDPKFTEEDKAQLRARTENLFAFRCEANSFSVAVVTHKGYLRELERGPFGHPEATEFNNCEIRVYRITMRDSKLVRAERINV